MEANKNFKRLYHLVKQVPEYREVRDGSGRKTNNSNLIIQGWIWQSTNEQKYQKHELTQEEYNRICNEIEKKYNIKPLIHRNKTGVAPSDNDADKLRKRLLAAVHENIKLRGYSSCNAYLNDRNTYAQNMILRSSGGTYKQLNELPSSKLHSLYSYFKNENKLYRK